MGETANAEKGDRGADGKKSITNFCLQHGIYFVIFIVIQVFLVLWVHPVLLVTIDDAFL